MSRFKRIGLVLIAASLGSIGAQAATVAGTGTIGAQGTQAGTTISNQARAEYQVNTRDIEALSNVEDFLVDEKIQVDVTKQAAAVTVQPEDLQRIQPFLVTNFGNATEAFSLNVVLPGGDNFSPILAGNNLVYLAAGAACDDGDIISAQSLHTGNDELVLASGGTALICAVADIPDATLAADGDEGFLDLVAISKTTGASAANAGAVLAGEGQGGGDAVVVNLNGRDQDTGVYVVSAVTVTVVKNITLVDDGFRAGDPGTAGGGRFIPGALVTYELVVTVSGSGTASNLVIIDEIRDDGTEMTYIPETVLFDGFQRTDTSGDDNVTVSNVTIATVPYKRIAVTLGNVGGDPQQVHTITFQVEVQ